MSSLVTRHGVKVRTYIYVFSYAYMGVTGVGYYGCHLTPHFSAWYPPPSQPPPQALSISSLTPIFYRLIKTYSLVIFINKWTIFHGLCIFKDGWSLLETLCKKSLRVFSIHDYETRILHTMVLVLRVCVCVSYNTNFYFIYSFDVPTLM